MAFRFQKIRELGSKGKKSNPLLLEEFQWENEWVDINCDPVHASNGSDMLWTHVDEAVGATDQLEAAICLGLLLLVRGILSPAHMGGITKGSVQVQGQMHQQLKAVIMKKRKTELHQNSHKVQVQ